MTTRATVWARRKRDELVKKFGGRCFICGSRDKDSLEFAHRRPTGVQGMGRGQKERVSDVAKHPFSYVLLCWTCHKWFDR